MDEPSPMLRAGRILVLVGAIVSIFGALVLVIATLGFAVLANMIPDNPSSGVNVVFTGLYAVIALVSIVGAVFGFLSYKSVGEGEIKRAWIQGLVAALLPPVQLLLLIGAVLILVSPEYGESA